MRTPSSFSLTMSLEKKQGDCLCVASSFLPVLGKFRKLCNICLFGTRRLAKLGNNDDYMKGETPIGVCLLTQS